MPEPQSNPPAPDAPKPKAPAAPKSKAPSVSQQVAARSLGNFKDALGTAWADKLSPEERQLAVDMLNDASALAVGSLFTGKSVAAELDQLWAQAAHVESIEATRFRQVITAALLRGLVGGLGDFVKLSAPYLL